MLGWVRVGVGLELGLGLGVEERLGLQVEVELCLRLVVGKDARLGLGVGLGVGLGLRIGVRSRVGLGTGGGDGGGPYLFNRWVVTVEDINYGSQFVLCVVDLHPAVVCRVFFVISLPLSAGLTMVLVLWVSCDRARSWLERLSWMILCVSGSVCV